MVIEQTEQTDHPRDVKGMLQRVDRAWEEFEALAVNFPAEHLDERIGDGWTRKQMLAHIAAWHDLTTERLGEFLRDGERHDLTAHEDEINARAARAAAGRTAGEIFDGLETSFRRLRRQLEHFSDQQLQAHDGWPLAIIAGNTYGHYEEHRPDLQ